MVEARSSSASLEAPHVSANGIDQIKNVEKEKFYDH